MPTDGTFYPAPLDFVVNFHLAAWEQYPDQCQKRLVLAYEMQDHMYGVLTSELEDLRMRNNEHNNGSSAISTVVYVSVGVLLGVALTCAAGAVVSP